MRNTIFYILLACMGWVYCMGCYAQEGTVEQPRVVTRTTMYGIGTTNVFDTYLSPLEYKGIEFRVSREINRMTRLFNGHVALQNFFQADIGYTENKAENNNTISGLANWNYGLHYVFEVTENFKFLAGGLLDINGGFLYNLRNSNNPASLRAFINLDASGMAVWYIKAKRRTLRLRYQANLPVIGCMFSPNYGQSYYEIFSLGHASGIINFTSLHNQPSLRQMLSIDVPMKNSTLRLSYIADLEQSKVNELKTHTYSHVFMVGFVRKLYRYRNGK